MSARIPESATNTTVPLSIQQPIAPPYAAAVAVEIVRVKPSGERDVRGLSGRVAVRWQDHARIEVHDGRGNPVGQVVADGQAVWTLASGSGRQRATFRQEPLQEGAVAAALIRGGLIGPEFADVIAGKEALAEEKAAKVVTVSEPARRAWGGVPVEVVTATFVAPATNTQTGGAAATPKENTSAAKPQPPVHTVTLVYGVADHHLLRVVSEQTLPDGSRVRRTETHTDIRVGTSLPDSLFVFTPPPGAASTTPRILPPLPAVSSLPGNAPVVPKNLQYRVGSIGTAPVKAGIAPTFRSGNREGAGKGTGTAGVTAEHRLSVIPAAEVLSPEPGMGVARLGMVTALDKQTVERVFSLKNTSDKPVTLDRLEALGGHITWIVKDAEGASGPTALATRTALRLPFRLDPGRSVAVFVRLDLAEIPVGPLAKSTLVYIREEPDQPAARLELAGSIKPLVTFEPAQVAFGNVKPEQNAPTQTVVATIAPELWEKSRAAGLERPELVSPDPLIRISVDADRSGLRENQVRYKVTLNPVGVSGVVSAIPSLVPQAASEKERDSNLAWTYARVMPLRIVAEVTGDISAQPRVVLFSPASGERGTRGTQSVTLTGKPGLLIGAEVRPETPNLSARLTVAPDGGSATLTITRAPNAPAGTREERIAVRVPKARQVFLIPVVTASGATIPTPPRKP